MTDGPVYNASLGDEILAQILNHPETHDQRQWSTTGGDCGTTMCVAGWACALSDVDLEYRQRDRFGRLMAGRTTKAVNGTRIIEYVAAHLLGLTPDRAVTLFYTMSDERAIKIMKFYANDPAGDSLPTEEDLS